MLNVSLNLRRSISSSPYLQRALPGTAQEFAQLPRRARGRLQETDGRLEELVTRNTDKEPIRSDGSNLAAYSGRYRHSTGFHKPASRSATRVEKNLPFYKFDSLLRNRVDALQYASSRFADVVVELGMSSEKRRLQRTFTQRLLEQPPSTYGGLPRSGKEAIAFESSSEIPTFGELKASYEESGVSGLDDLLVSKFGLFVSVDMLTAEDLQVQHQLADMSNPAEWYPLARSIPRKLHLHVGPTNSGKTYHALQRLQKAKSGCFAGPLRLLAFEIYDRFNRAGVPCNLLTGEERRTEEGVMLTSSTIEMLNTSQEMDVLVIDEIQMIADPDRGSAWTQALLGSPAKEIHMCGEASVVDLVKNIAESLGETVEIHNYTRLGALEPMQKSLGGTFQAIEEGDAVVTFSRKNIFEVKRSIEQSTGKKCAVVYGGLPPETRAAQAKLFNDPDSGFDVMVASDAIGMGLNLSIKRVVFETLEKWNGKESTTLPIPQVKQIAGRAGRFKPKTKVSDVNELDPPKEVPGYVTTLRDKDLEFLHESLATPTVQLTKATLKPPAELIDNFMRPYPAKIKKSMIMQQLQAFAKTSELYEIRNLTSCNGVLDLLQPVKGLQFADTWTLVDAPLKMRDPKCVRAYLEMARMLGSGKRADLLDLEEVDIDLIDEGVPETQEQLLKFESLHHQLTLYLWLSMRFPGVFCSMIEVYQLKQATEEMIQIALERLKSKKKSGAGLNQFVSSSMLLDQRKQRQRTADLEDRYSGRGNNRHRL